jgi:hypothetical protein
MQAIAHNAVVQNGLIAPAKSHDIGATPPNFNSDIPAYHHNDIYDLIIFYNDDFEIVVGDTLLVRVDKFRRFLSKI